MDHLRSAGDARTPFFALDSAKNWQEFRKAFSQFGAPGQNVVYADVDGNIGYQATGLIPIRAAGDGSLPVPGEDDSARVDRLRSLRQLPSVYNPPSGIIATANGRITPDGYPYTLSIEWDVALSHPAHLQAAERRQENDARQTCSPSRPTSSRRSTAMWPSGWCTPWTTRPVLQPRQAAADLLRNWDGQMAIDSVAATIAYFSREQLEEMLLKPKLGDDWKQYSGS